MGNFINTTYKDTMDYITSASSDIIKNPLYIFNDKKALKVLYYNINCEKSTLDEAAKIPYSDLGLSCPFRFNRINDMFIYGAEKIQLSLENGDFGLESGEIVGEAIILPNTITPYPGDYFEIPHIKSKLLFRVNEVQKDTLDDGANIWKISYKLEHVDNTNILPLIVSDWNMVVNNIGTSYSPVIESNKYNIIEILDNTAVQLKNYFKDIFYNEKVQTFCFTGFYLEKFYDPYMIEFLKRNKILSNSGQKDYVYIDHKLELQKTFSRDYNKTFFRSLETKDINHLKKAKIKSTAEYIKNIMSIFSKRPEDYFCLNYIVPTYESVPTPYAVHDILQCFPDELLHNIVENKYFEEEDKLFYNIIIKYFNNKDIVLEDITCLEYIDYLDNINLFFAIPMLIFCIEYTIKKMMSTTYK